jgi:hypothetical protein
MPLSMISASGRQTIGPASGGKVVPFNNISTAPQVVIANNPMRAKITFHNPGSVDIMVAPTTQANGQALTVSPTLLGGCYRVYANGGDRVVEGECQTAWQAFSVTGSNNSLTVSESNV